MFIVTWIKWHETYLSLETEIYLIYLQEKMHEWAKAL